MKVENMESKGVVANQFLIRMDDCVVFQSYDSIIAVKFFDERKTLLDERYWDYSSTTGKYRNMFLGEGIAETRKKIESGTYVLTNLQGMLGDVNGGDPRLGLLRCALVGCVTQMRQVARLVGGDDKDWQSALADAEDAIRKSNDAQGVVRDALDDEAESIARDTGVCWALAELVRDGEEYHARKLAETWGFHTTEDLLAACKEDYDREQLVKIFPSET